MFASCNSRGSISFCPLAVRPCRAFRRETVAGRAKGFFVTATMNSDRSLINIARRAVWAKSNGQCWYCGCEVQFGSKDFTIDHFIPSSKGGLTELDNLFPCCKLCNTIKRNRTIDEFRSYLAKTDKFKTEQVMLLKFLGYHDVEERLKSHAANYFFWYEQRSQL